MSAAFLEVSAAFPKIRAALLRVRAAMHERIDPRRTRIASLISSIAALQEIPSSFLDPIADRLDWIDAPIHLPAERRDIIDGLPKLRWALPNLPSSLPNLR